MTLYDKWQITLDSQYENVLHKKMDYGTSSPFRIESVSICKYNNIK